ncbi:formate dehydrogenase accessory sulfurtransferase FdhD [Deinococcus sp. KNUC1210]|uniref:formate dehydrogenase accessory sulfurtransferase FdhD n=1 Tax=Deinococcus sp. KNUC1210 TaxID=2917691 RepID=UPI001EEFBB4E|nr:formate dehydrogenase accessory sulfurtransferase FdhD [Deinococcus sp. KNUC1210]ULH15797.1 formate dehydrogenase accessory sulfurtransferase FdhD [Deinococcus sp. KNUC1210]
MSGPQLDFFAVRRHTGGTWEHLSDAVAVEEPLELRVGTAAGSVPLSVMMRTPGHDLELVRGWLHAEGLLAAVTAISVLPGAPNVLLLDGDRATLLAAQRGSVTSSACGVCGSGSVERLMLRVSAPVWTAPPLPPATIRGLPEVLRAAQPAFEASGGLHAAGLFDASGRLLHAFEDVGRHNAVDKAVGAALPELPLGNRVLVTSSRAGFEIVQKALLAGIAVVVTVGAPSSLAVETAVSLGLTLVGFVRGGRFNVYAGAERLDIR